MIQILSVRNLWWTFSLAFLFSSCIVSQVNKYQTGDGFDLRYVIAASIGDNRRVEPKPLWIFQPGDGNVLDEFSPFWAKINAEKIARDFDVNFVFPELRRQKLRNDLRKYCELDFFHRVDDLNNLIDALKTIPVNTSEIVLFGHSAGSEIVSLTAIGRSDIAAVVTFGGGVLQLSDYLKRSGEFESVKGMVNNGCTEQTYKMRSGRFWSQLLYSKMNQAIELFSGPYIALFGANDETTKMAPMAGELSELSRKKANFSVEMISDRGHELGAKFDFESWSRAAKHLSLLGQK